MLLPVGQERVREDALAATAAVGAGRGERVLLVEDQPHVREAVRRVLEGARFHVTTA